jgi:hypothetical protein
MVTGDFASVGRLCEIKESGSLAVGRYCRVGARYGDWVLELDPRHAYFRSDFAGRVVDWLFKTVLGRWLSPLAPQFPLAVAVGILRRRVPS